MGKKKNQTPEEVTQQELPVETTATPVENTQEAPAPVETVAQDATSLVDDTQNNVDNQEQPIAQETKDQIDSSEQSSQIVIDNTMVQDMPEAPTVLDRTPKLKEPISKKKRITIACIALAIIAILCCSIIIPCVLYYKDKCVISKPSDFEKGKSGKYYKLSKDITYDGNLTLSTGSSIDLNGHSLIVNGTLTIKCDSSDPIFIGTKEKSGYQPTGALLANSLVIDTKNADVDIVAPTTIKGKLEVLNAKSFSFNGISLVNASTINAKKVVIREALSVNEAELSCTITSENVQILGTVLANSLIFKESTITTSSYASLQNVILDDQSTLQLYGKAASITNGQKVAVLNDGSCPQFNSIQLLGIYKPYTKTFTANNCAKVITIDKLPTPVDLIVKETDGKFIANCAPLVGIKDVKYKFYYVSPNGSEKQSPVDTSNEYDISDLLRAETGAAVVTIKAKGVGNYNFDETFVNTLNNGDWLYVDSDLKSISYTYSLTLATPKNLRVEQNTADGNIYLTFDAVEFADYYTITIDGTSYKEKTNTVDVTKYLTTLGYHSIKVSAGSNSSVIVPSKQALTSWRTEQQLPAPVILSATCAKNESDETYTVIITLEENANIPLYTITLNGKQYTLSSTNTLTIVSEEDLTNATFIVKAEGYSFYKPSEFETGTISPIQ